MSKINTFFFSSLAFFAGTTMHNVLSDKIETGFAPYDLGALSTSDTLSAFAKSASKATMLYSDKGVISVAGDEKVNSLGNAFTIAKEKTELSNMIHWAIVSNHDGEEVARVRCNPQGNGKPATCLAFKPVF